MSNERSIHSLFPVAVQVTDIAGAEALNARMMGDIAKIRGQVPNCLPEAWSCNLYTTISSGMNVFDFPSFSELRQHIMTEATAFAQSYGFDTDAHPLKIADCWINIYGDGDAQEAHIHQNCVISGIYYAAASENSGEVLFHSPRADSMLEPPTVGTNPFNTPVNALQPTAGTMVLFRSWLRHSVKPTVGKEERISVAFNLSM